MGKKSARRSVKKLIDGIEGGFSNHSSDPGGKTKYGITEDKAREHGYEGEMKDLPLEKAYDIYIKDFWDKQNLDIVAEYSEAVAFEVFETNVHTGDVGSKILQSLLNIFNKQGEYYDEIKVDGIIGEKTLKAYKEFFLKRRASGMKVLLTAQNARQGEYYYKLAEENPKFEDFVFGWFNKRVKI